MNAITRLFARTSHFETIKIKYGGLNRSKLEVRNDVQDIIVHPNYKVSKTMGFDFDIAIIRLKDQVIESPTIKIIELADRTPPAGTKAVLTGWGITIFGEKKEIPATMLQKVELTIMDASRCMDMSPEMPPLNNRFICARTPSATACSVGENTLIIKNNRAYL